VLRVSSAGAQGCRRGGRDLGVGLLAQAGNTDSAHHFVIYVAVQASAARARKPYCDRFAFLMASTAMKYADTATISRPAANAIPSINITIFPFTRQAMNAL
jgi:hypothetical protein